MALAAIAIVVCFLKKEIGTAILLAGALYESIVHIRFQAILAIFVVVIGGSILPYVAKILGPFRKSAEENRAEKVPASLQQISFAPGIALVALFTSFAGVRSYDLVSNKHYIDAGETTLFGAGESWWFPEKAMDFLEKEKLPANLFHDYNAGGYLTWRVGERYPDFADGRFIPFVPDIFTKQRALLAASPDSASWKESAERWGINTIVLSLSRYAGLSGYSLADYCNSKTWKPVYADDVSIIFVRNRAESMNLLNRFTIDCAKMILPAPAVASGNSWNARAERFNFLMNAASVYYILSRDAEASATLQEAASLFPDNASFHLLTAQLLQTNNHLEEAEREYTRAVNERPSDAGWFALATLYSSQHRYAEAERCVKEAIGYSQIPYERLRSLGLLYLLMGRPKDALTQFDRAEQKSPFRDNTSEEGRSFNARLAAARAKAYRAMNDLSQALAQQERATELTPENPAAWDILAELAQAQGDAARAKGARDRAENLRSSVGASPAR
jgi:tetratricopeptide (TPR) repeat protein